MAEKTSSEGGSELLGVHMAWARQQNEVEQTLGKALGYPWLKDDQKNFPGATEEHGVCVGDHVVETLAQEAAERIAALQAKLDMPATRALLESLAEYLEDHDGAVTMETWVVVEELEAALREHGMEVSS